MPDPAVKVQLASPSTLEERRGSPGVHVPGTAQPARMSNRMSVVLESLSGLAAGVATSFFMSPFDVARTRMQIQEVVPSMPAHLKAKDPFHAFRLIYQAEGPRGFFRGYSAAGVAIPVFWSIYFSLYSASKRVLGDYQRAVTGGAPPTKLQNAAVHSGAATFTAMVCDFITNPLWVARTRLQTQWLHMAVSQAGAGHGAAALPGHGSLTAAAAFASAGAPAVYTGWVDALRQIYRQEGLRACYKGLFASWLGASQVAIQFPVYERLKELVTASELRYLTVPVEEASALQAEMRAQRARFRSAEMETDAEMAAVSSVTAADLIDPASAMLPVGAFPEDLTESEAVVAEYTRARVGQGVAGNGEFPANASEPSQGRSGSATSAAAPSESASSPQHFRPSAFGLLFASVSSKMVASALTYPHETIRARLQDQRGSGVGEGQFRGVWDCARKTYLAEGWGGLYSGFSVNLLRALPAVATTFYTYEAVHSALLRWLDHDAPQRDEERFV